MPPSADRPKLAAYIMLAEPYWLRASVTSYYDSVEHIFVSHDKDGLGWSGQPLDLATPMAILRGIDTDRKITYISDEFYQPGLALMAQETRQRQLTLAALPSDVDWCFQLDTDEVLPAPEALIEAIRRADAAGHEAVDFPSRWIYARLGESDRYLERSSRFWRRAASYPGALAVRPGVKLRFARQTESLPWRVDFRQRNSDPSHSRNHPVDQVVPYAAAVRHFSWVRPESGLRAKGNASGHANDFDWDAATDLWLHRQRHPLRSCLTTPLPRRPFGHRLRLTRVPDPGEML